MLTLGRDYSVQITDYDYSDYTVHTVLAIHINATIISAASSTTSADSSPIYGGRLVS